MPSNPLLGAVGISQAVPKPLEEGSSQQRYRSFVSKGKKKRPKIFSGGFPCCLGVRRGVFTAERRMHGDTRGCQSRGARPRERHQSQHSVRQPRLAGTMALGTPPQGPPGNRLTQRVPGQGLRREGEQALVTPSGLLQARCCPSSR